MDSTNLDLCISSQHSVPIPISKSTITSISSSISTSPPPTIYTPPPYIKPPGGVLKKGKRNRIHIPTSLPTVSISTFPPSTAPVLVVTQWLTSMCTPAELKRVHLGARMVERWAGTERWNGKYLHEARPATLARELTMMGFMKGRAKTIAGFVVGARRLSLLSNSNSGGSAEEEKQQIKEEGVSSNLNRGDDISTTMGEIPIVAAAEKELAHDFFGESSLALHRGESLAVNEHHLKSSTLQQRQRPEDQDLGLMSPFIEMEETPEAGELLEARQRSEDRDCETWV
ncbi:hypothetical protein LZ554_004434 [Drepanopeziza brunnea f. sp. 'monogermtubi']|nr:hypothetical protein LZ554_004434 [Drepanopeziza brunnea f. sp. 'monogermtubi']